MDFQRTRSMVLGAGLLVLVVTAAALYLLAVDLEEVIAVTFFLPVFAAAVLGGWRWGVVAGAIAGLAYLGMRLDDLSVLSNTQQWTRPVSYGIAYLVFGGVSGWAAAQLSAGITKLDRFDVVDDESELLNARGLHRQLDQEVARARRYGSDFAVVTVTFEVTGDRAHRQEVRRRIGDIVRVNVRAVDDTGRISVDGRDVVIAVLPETPRNGAEIVGAKVANLLDRDDLTGDTDVRWLTHPEDDDEIDELLATLQRVVDREHPEAAARR